MKVYRGLFALILGSCFLFQSHLSANTETQKADTTVYLLSPFDQVAISVYGQSDLDSRQRISDKGEVSVPLLGNVAVGGLSVSDAQKLIESTFIRERYLVKPVVTISIDEFSPKVVTVLGEVQKPGSIKIPPGRNKLPIQIVIAETGGFTGAAQKTEVHVNRESDDVNATKKKTIKVNISSLLETSGKGGDNNVFFVQPDDIVFVPRRLF
jgi:polysaccharide export outer membrane protein